MNPQLGLSVCFLLRNRCFFRYSRVLFLNERNYLNKDFMISNRDLCRSIFFVSSALMNDYKTQSAETIYKLLRLNTFLSAIRENHENIVTCATQTRTGGWRLNIIYQKGRSSYIEAISRSIFLLYSDIFHREKYPLYPKMLSTDSN